MGVWKTVTVKSAAGDYTALRTAITTEAVDLAAQNLGDLEIVVHDLSDSTRIIDTDFGGYTTNATNRVLITAADDHAGKWSTSVYRLEITTGGEAFTFSDIEDLVVTGIQIRTNSSASTSRILEQFPGATRGTIKFIKCIFILDHNDVGDTVTAARIQDASATVIFQNCIFSGSGTVGTSTGIAMSSSGGTPVYFDNCVVDGFTTALNITSTTDKVRFRNSRITNGTNTVAGAGQLHSDSNFNLTDLAAPTNWGANSIDSGDAPTIGYVDDSNATMTSRDFHLAASTDSGHETGQDLSGDGVDPFSDDIDGTARTVPWDIGTHELSTGATTAGVPDKIHMIGLNASVARASLF